MAKKAFGKLAALLTIAGAAAAGISYLTKYRSFNKELDEDFHDFEDEDETEEVKIVTSIRGNSLEGRISIESPLGKALLGHKVGDRVHVQVGNGGYDVEIRAIDKDGGEEESIRKF